MQVKSKTVEKILKFWGLDGGGGAMAPVYTLIKVNLDICERYTTSGNKVIYNERTTGATTKILTNGFGRVDVNVIPATHYDKSGKMVRNFQYSNCFTSKLVKGRKMIMKKIFKRVCGTLILSVGMVSILTVSKIGGAETDDSETKEYKQQLFDAAKECAKYNEDKKAFGDTDEKIEKSAEIISAQSGADKEEVQDILYEEEERKATLERLAREAGISVTEQEVSAEIEKVRGLLHSDEQSEEELRIITDGLGMSEEEYWESVRPVYERNLLIDKYVTQEAKNKGYDADEQHDISVRYQIEDNLVEEAK